MLAEQTAIITRGIPVTIVPRSEETPVQSLARQLETYRAINTLIDMTFVEGEDYGMISGVTGYSLRVPGIEKSMGLLGLREEFHDIEVVRDYSPTAPFFYYEVECVLVSIVTGQEVARGQGVCHTREKTFTRQAKRKCPKCSVEAVNRSKNEGEGWYCWKKENGCGATFTEKDPAIISQEVGNVIDPQLVWDGINRARKVANKRAISSAIRRVAMLSGKFVKRLSNGTTEIRYTPAEVKQMTALARTTPTITGVPSTEQSRESMGSGGTRRVDPPKPAEQPAVITEQMQSDKLIDTEEPKSVSDDPAKLVTIPEWYTEGRRGLVLNDLKEADLIPKGATWIDLLNLLEWQADDCYRFKTGYAMVLEITPLLREKKQERPPEPPITEPEAVKLANGEATPNPTLSGTPRNRVTGASDNNTISPAEMAGIEAQIVALDTQAERQFDFGD